MEWAYIIKIPDKLGVPGLVGFFKYVLDSFSVCTIIYDLSGKVVYINRAKHLTCDG